MAIKGYWRLNGNSNDASGNSNNGTDTSIVYSQSNGVLNGGADFNGSSGRITLNSTISSLFNSKNEWTVSLLFNMDAVGNSLFFSITSSSSSFLLRNCIIYLSGNSPNDAIIVRRYNGTDGSLVVSPYIFYTGKWYNVIVTYINDTISIYNNGAITSGVGTDTRTASSGGYAAIGAFYQSNSLSNYFNGKMDNLIIDNTAWSPAQVKNEYSRIKGFF